MVRRAESDARHKNGEELSALQVVRDAASPRAGAPSPESGVRRVTPAARPSAWNASGRAGRAHQRFQPFANRNIQVSTRLNNRWAELMEQIAIPLITSRLHFLFDRVVSRDHIHAHSGSALFHSTSPPGYRAFCWRLAVRIAWFSPGHFL